MQNIFTKTKLLTIPAKIRKSVLILDNIIYMYAGQTKDTLADVQRLH
ncbi:hypothetical protein R9X48_05745 [Lacticaseibacillus rhamnosus]